MRKATKGTTKASSNGLVTIKLGIVDRFSLLSILPIESGIATIRLVDRMSKKLTPDEKEQEAIELKPIPDGGISFKAEKASDRNFSFSGFEVELVVQRLKKLDKDEKLTKAHMELWDKFVVDKKSETEG